MASSTKTMTDTPQNDNDDNVKTQRSMLSSVAIVATCTLGMIVNIANTTSPSIAMPTIARELNIQQVQLEWIISAYALSSGCLLLICGRLADLYGRKKAFVLGSLWLLAFTIGCGFAQDALTLDILRGLQGVGPAAMIPASLGTLAHTFPSGPARAIAFATFSAGAPVGGSIGMVLGGIVTQLTDPSWRSPFFLNAGITSLCLVGALLFFDRDEPSTEVDRRVDWIGGLLVTAGLVLVVFVLAQGEVAPNKWATPYIIALLIVGVLLVLAFLFWQYHLERLQDRLPSTSSLSSRLSAALEKNMTWLPSPPPLMRLSLWTRAKGQVAAVMWIAFLNWCAFQGWSYWVMLYYQDYMGYEPLRTVVRLIPMFVTGIICNVVFAAVIGHVPMVLLVAFGTCLTGCAGLLFAVINPDAPYWAFGFPAAILSVTGADFVFATGTIFVAKVCLPHEQSVGGAVFQTMTQLGTSLGVTVSTIVFNRVLVQHAPRPAQLDAYKAAQWTNFAFGMFATLLTVIFLRRVGIIGRPGPGDSDDTDIEKSSEATIIKEDVGGGIKGKKEREEED
ncbi:hypothetical protein D9758_009104 [Tetrapyrgos nigripes]|uniref:Major facilitator superfamily (MFS) profile domain-containing protein n=1 Tax=Tetrapyrgos nigripes TaxID=182062 RepID=A0A8H5G8H6_9AGAR|nr:hypothetical protein D9758_009104 [Tetrapyrgos nigripes]